MKMRILMSLALVVAGEMAWGQDNVIRDPAQAVREQPQAGDDPKSQLDQAKQDAQTARDEAGEARKAADQAKQEAARARSDAGIVQSTSTVRVTQYVTNPNPVFVSLTRMKLEAIRKHDQMGVDVTCSITLVNVPNIPFTFEAVLVDASGKVHTNAQGTPYSGSREVSTGDQEDTDKYTVWISCAGLFSSRPPAELYVQARLIDAAGKIVATSAPELFHAPRD